MKNNERIPECHECGLLKLEGHESFMISHPDNKSVEKIFLCEECANIFYSDCAAWIRNLSEEEK